MRHLRARPDRIVSHGNMLLTNDMEEERLLLALLLPAILDVRKFVQTVRKSFLASCALVESSGGGGARASPGSEGED